MQNRAARKYKVFIGTSPGGESFKPVDTELNLQFGDKDSATVTGLDPGRRYYFAVAALLRNGEITAFSNEASAIPRAGHRFW